MPRQSATSATPAKIAPSTHGGSIFRSAKCFSSTHKATPNVARSPYFSAIRTRSVRRVLARQTGVRGIARLVTRILGLERAVAARNGEQNVFLVNELLARVVRRRVRAGVH